MRVSWARTVMVLLVLFRPVPAAGESCMVWVQPAPAFEQERREIRQQIARAFAERGLPEPRFVDAALPPALLAADAVSAQRLLERAREEYRRFESEAVLATLAQARQTLVDGCGIAPAELLLAIELLDGLVRILAGEREAAGRAFERVFEIDPSYVPDERLLSPKITALLSQARQAVQTRPVATLEVRALPAEADLLLDGRAAGTAETSRNVPPGEHCLAVRAPGFDTLVRRLRLLPGEKIALTVVLPPAFDGPVEPGAIAAALAARHGSDWAMWVAVTDEEVRAAFASALADAPPQEARCPCQDAGPCLARRFEEIRAERNRIVERPPPVASVPQPLPPPVPSPEPERPWYRQWWFWTSVGAAVATGVALGLALALSADEPGYRIVLGRP